MIRDILLSVAKVLGMSTVWLVIVIGNATLIAIYFREPDLKRLIRFRIILSLAIADLLYGLAVIGFDVIYLNWGIWYFSYPFCVIWKLLDVTLSTSSFLHLPLLALNQFLTIKCRSDISSNKRVSMYNLFIALIWLYSILYSLFTLLLCKDCFPHQIATKDGKDRFYLEYFGKSYNRTITKGTIRLSDLHVERQAYPNFAIATNATSASLYDVTPMQCEMKVGIVQVSIFCASFYTIALAVVILCIMVVYRLNIYSKTLKHNLFILSSVRIARMQQNRRAIAYLISIATVFLLCWLPFFLFLTLQLFYHPSNIPVWLMPTLSWITYVNSAINPVVYFFMHSLIRQKMYKMRASMDLVATRAGRY